MTLGKFGGSAGGLDEGTGGNWAGSHRAEVVGIVKEIARHVGRHVLLAAYLHELGHVPLQLVGLLVVDDLALHAPQGNSSLVSFLSGAVAPNIIASTLLSLAHPAEADCPSDRQSDGRASSHAWLHG